MDINKVENADGYEIYRSTKKKKGYKSIGASTELNYIDKIQPNKTYYYKVRAYRIINDKKYYSGYSNIGNIKINIEI